MTNCPIIPEEFTLHWKVTNFDACFLHNHESFDSPSFSLKNFCNTRWYLRLSLESHRKYGFEYVWALVREYDEGPTSVGVYFRASCQSDTIAEGLQTFTKGSKYDFKVPELYDFDKFPQMTSLIFKCEMYFNFGDETLIDNSTFLNYFQSCCLKPHLPTNLKEDISADFMNTDKRIYTYPRQAFAFSHYLVERQIFILPIRDFTLQKIVTTSFTEKPSLSVELSVVSEDDFDYVKINFFLVDTKLKSNLLLYSEVSFIDSNLGTIDSGKDYHLFKRNHADEIWSFGHFFDWNQILKANDSNNLHFSCQLFFFDGQLQSEILWTTDIGRLSEEWILDSDIFDKNTREKVMSEETVHQAKCSIVCIKKDQTTPMFPTLSRNIDEVVCLGENSDSLKLETVNQNVKAGHLECGLQQTEFKKVISMYSNEEEFQMMSLKNENRTFLEENLDIGDFYSVLITADIHQDRKLCDAVIEFISIHKNKILKSKTWEKFAEKNCKLAMKILTEVCVKLPEKVTEL